MPLRRAALTLLSATVLTAAFAAPAGAQATRTWVSGVGDDANPCSRTAPCKTLPGAISKTASGGEINAIDPGPFGFVTIAKPITVDLSAAGTGGVLNAGVNGITVNAAATDDVVLRGIDLLGGNDASPTCRYGGLSGVWIRNARSVRIENTTIAQNEIAGIRVAPEASDPTVLVNRVDISASCGNGIKVEPAAGRSAAVMVRDATVTTSGTAVSVAGGGHAWLTGSTIFGNTLGLETLGGGVIETYEDTRIVGNAVDGTPTVAHTNTGAPGAPGAPGATGPQGPAGEPAVKLMLALPAARLSARAGKRVALRYAATAAGRATLQVRRGSKRIATVRGAAKAGGNKIAWSGKVRRKAVAAGTYKLMLRVTGADGQSDTQTARLRVMR